MAHVAGQGLRPDGGRLDGGPKTHRLDHGRQEPRLLADRIDEERPGGGQGDGKRDPRIAAAGTEVDVAIDCALAQRFDRRDDYMPLENLAERVEAVAVGAALGVIREADR